MITTADAAAIPTDAHMHDEVVLMSNKEMMADPKDANRRVPAIP
jgi:hypothetical protein